jgi:hypothetical protein
MVIIVWLNAYYKDISSYTRDRMSNVIREFCFIYLNACTDFLNKLSNQTFEIPKYWLNILVWISDVLSLKF